MQTKSFLFFMVFLTSVFSHAGYYGFNIGAGLPYLSQARLNYVTDSNRFSAELSYNVFNVTIETAKVSLVKPEIALKWHPLAGSFFMGVGYGQQALKATATDSTTQQTAEIEVTSNTLTPMLGWMWGVNGGGFFAGLDFGLQMPSNAKTKITSALPSDNEAYEDAEKAAKDYGESNIPLFTFFRMGWLF